MITDGAGQYKIVDLRPGDYDVNFTLTWLLPRHPAGVADQRLVHRHHQCRVESRGSVQETVTVAGQSPLVDVQNVQRLSG